MTARKLFLKIFLFAISFVIFVYLETGFRVDSINKLSEPLIFAFGMMFTFNFKYKKYLLFFSFLLLFGTILAYLFWQLSISDWLGSISLGILVIYAIGLLPDLLRRGYIEKS